MLRFFAVLLTGLALIAPGAHVYELANKMPLPKAEYFVVQKIYIGWWFAGLLLPISLLVNLALAYAESNLLALMAAILLFANLIIFYFFTYPVNVETVNWTVMPDNWEVLRRQWELSHTVNAVVTLLAFCLSIAAALRKISA
jgi:hypothetical protein